MLRPLAWLVALLALAVLALQGVLHSLDRPWLKQRLLERARTSTGVDIDYGSARVDLLSGAVIEGLVVQSPAEVRPFAPELVRVGRVEAAWSPGSLLRGRGPMLERLAVSDVTLTAVVDENGRTSFDALSPAGATPPEPGPKTPLSAQASKVFASAPPIGQLQVERVTVVLVRTERGQAAERAELQGLGLAMTTSAAPGGWRLDAHLGSPDGPLDLKLTRARGDAEAGAARAKLWVTVGASADAVTAALDLRMVDQTFATSVSADHWLHADAGLRFDRTAGRTEATLDHLEAGDGAVTADASLDVPDDGELLVRRARADVDVARLLKWLPVGLVPVTAERAHVRCQIESLVAASVPRLSTGGSATLDAELANVAASAPGGPVDVGEAKLSLHAQPTEAGGIAGRGSLELKGVRLSSGATRLAADDVTLELDGERAANEGIQGSAGVRFVRVEAEGGSTPAVARDGRVELHLGDLHLDAQEPLSTRGDVALSVDLGSLDAHAAGMHTTVEGLALHAHTSLEGHAPYDVELDAPMSRLRVVAHDGPILADAPARLGIKAHDVQPDLDHPVATRGVFEATVELGKAQASLDATKGANAVDYKLHVALPSLKIVRPFLSPDLGLRAPWDRMAVDLRSTGHVEPLGGPGASIRQTTELDVERFAFGSTAARSLALKLRSHGTALEHQADLDVRLPGLTLDGGPPSDDHVTLSATVDRERPSLQVDLATEGRASTKVSASLSFDPSRKAVLYETKAHLAGLAPLAPFAAAVHGLDAIDLSQLEVGFSARGALLGVVAGIGRDGTMVLEPSPARTAAVDGPIDLQVSHLHWARGDTVVAAPALSWHGDLRSAGTGRTLESHLEAGSLHVDLGSHTVDLRGVKDQETVTVSGDMEDPDLTLAQHLSLDGVTQDFAPDYPLGDVTVALAVERSPDGVVHISEAKLADGLAGTTLAVSGNVDLGEGHRKLSVGASLTQDLAPLSTHPERFAGRGKVGVEAKVTSPDLAFFTVRAVVKGDDVNVTLPGRGIALEAANGEVPITVTLDVTSKKGVWLERGGKQHQYSMLRFADQHPLLSNSGFLSIGRIKTPWVTIAPLAGSLEIEQNLFSLRQFELGVRGGTITGQCGFDWEGRKSTLELHVRVSGVQSSHGEPFDGNASVILSAADRSIEGRAEIVRIGERHLLDLLDLEDPLHTDPAMNRVRSLLAFGYPDSLRLVFDHGFASAHLQLGGIARLISIGELRGIPMGPIIDKMIAPLLEGPDTKEAL